MKNLRLLLIVLVVLDTFGCRHQSLSRSEHNEPRSEVKVVNGVPVDSGFMNAVVMFTSSAGFGCSGTFINKTVLLTAAHCVFDAQSISIGSHTSLRILMANPNFALLRQRAEQSRWADEDLMNFVENDYALAEFEPSVTAHLGITDFPPIALNPNVLGQMVLLIGYGRTEAENDASKGGKNWGWNHIDYVSGGMLVIQGGTSFILGDDVLAGKMDSGGPLLLNNAEAIGDETIVGVASIGTDIKGPGESFFAYVQAPIARNFFSNAINAGLEPFEY